MRDTPRKRRSNCPINASLEVVGDRWSLLIVRDLMFGGARTYKNLHAAGERIATNVLADRLAKLQAYGIIAALPDPDDGRSTRYRLTAKGVELAPVLLELNRWGTRFEGGEAPPGILKAWDADRRAFLARLRRDLLDSPPDGGAEG